MCRLPSQLLTRYTTRHFDPRYTFAEEYRVPQEMGVLQVFPSSRNTTAQEVVARVMRNRAMFEVRRRPCPRLPSCATDARSSAHPRKSTRERARARARTCSRSSLCRSSEAAAAAASFSAPKRSCDRVCAPCARGLRFHPCCVGVLVGGNVPTNTCSYSTAAPATTDALHAAAGSFVAVLCCAAARPLAPRRAPCQQSCWCKWSHHAGLLPAHNTAKNRKLSLPI